MNQGNIPPHISEEIGEHLDAIGRFFKPGAKLTLLIRNDVGKDLDADAVFTNDELPIAIVALQHRERLDNG